MSYKLLLEFIISLLTAIEAGSSTRVTLTCTSKAVFYTVNVNVSTIAVQQYSTLIVQAHTQKNILTLNSQNVTAVNGSHVGLVQLLSKGLDRLLYYVMCYPHGDNKDDIAVLIVAQLLANEGM